MRERLHCSVYPAISLKSIVVMLLLFMATAPAALAQRVISGKVKASEDNSDLPGVTITIPGTTTGTITDIDGNYSIKIPEGATQLSFSFIGYATQVKEIGAQAVVDVVLEVETEMLEEIVMIGYGEQTKKEVTGAVASVGKEELLRSATPDVSTALQGQIAGVNVQASSGAPGSTANILIRGVTSVFGQNAPLWVVDGVPYDRGDEPRLSPNEIESIDVLKDAASAAIYGSRGAAGVILVTTKQGEPGSLKVNIDSYVGIQNIQSRTDLLQADEQLYVDFQQQFNLKGPSATYETEWMNLENNAANLTQNTQLAEDVISDNALMQNHSVNVSGGTDQVRFNLSGAYFTQDGTILKSKYERFNSRANMTYKDKKWMIRTNLMTIISDQKRVPFNSLETAIRYNPLRESIDVQNPIIPEGFLVEGDISDGQLNNLNNVLYRFSQRDTERRNQFNGNIDARYTIMPGWTVTTRLAGTFDDGLRKLINPSFIVFNDDGELQAQQSRSRVRNTHNRNTKTVWETNTQYTKKFNKKHKLTALVNFSTEKYTRENFWGEKFDLVSNEVTALDGALIDPRVQSNNNRTSTIVGMLGRVQYDYKSKYLLSVSMRRDQSSRFSPDNNVGYFPSASLGWNVSDEPFWDPIAGVVNTFKLRASYGTVGNQGINDYAYQPVIVLGKDYPIGLDDNARLGFGGVQESYVDEDIKWEVTVQRNLGLDMYMLNNQIQVNADVFYTDKTDMLMPVQLPLSAGAGTGNTGRVIRNVGNMVNKGVELAASYRKKGDFTYNIGVNLSIIRNEVTKISGLADRQYLAGSTVINGAGEDVVSALQVGREAGSFYLLETDGLIDSEVELEQYQKLDEGARMGDLKFVDRNGDGIIDDDDRYYAGSWMPDYTLGLNFGCNWKGIDFSMDWYASVGSELINGNRAFAIKEKRHGDLLYQWSPSNPDTEVPVFYSKDHPNARSFSDYWIEDGSYIRLRTISLGYTLPKRWVESIKLTRIRVYASGQNVLTLTEYSGFDPEVAGYDSTAGRSSFASRGIDKGTYPLSAVYRGGIQIQF
ncbi:SusC/RagA family TonB-linked outer membrane protein [Reichenbachiella versicolor]|uniref:SusC/RagA family TonB-linked outer membrane protein n=1 Tax=Reichenbachiella versicolor TaxID=1821036 RepID=UPI000D6DE7E2|nr:TonB-dependent receptor [Reichenbachiella versicolor]